MTRNAADGQLIVGPVSATAPELPVSLVMETNGDHLLRVIASTAAGHSYIFNASRQLSP